MIGPFGQRVPLPAAKCCGALTRTPRRRRLAEGARAAHVLALALLIPSDDSLVVIRALDLEQVPSASSNMLRVRRAQDQALALGGLDLLQLLLQVLASTAHYLRVDLDVAHFAGGARRSAHASLQPARGRRGVEDDVLDAAPGVRRVVPAHDGHELLELPAAQEELP